MAGQHLIAVVDDDLSVRRAVGRLLSSAGFQVAAFSAGADLLASEEAALAECVVLDIHLGGPDGFEVCDSLRAAGIDSTVIFLTAHDSVETRARAASYPHSFFLRKPFDATSLLDLVGVAVEEEPRPGSPRSRAARADA